MIYILRDSLRGAYFIKRSRVPFHQYQILLFWCIQQGGIFDQNITSGAKKFCKLRDIGLSELIVFSKILTYS